MNKRFLIVSLLIGVAANAVYALLLYVLHVPRPFEILFTISVLLLLPFALLEIRQFRKHGFARIWNAADNKFDLLTQIHSSEKSFFFMGVSARTILQPQNEAVIVQKLLTHHEYEIRFLLFDRHETVKLQRRALEETGNPETADEWSEIMKSTVQMIRRLKKTLGATGDRLQLRIYKSFPVFRMLIVDSKYVLLTYYPRNRFPTNLDCLELRGPDDPSSFGYALRKYFDEVWSEAEAIGTRDEA